MNYSAQNILHIYKYVKKEIKEILNSAKIKPQVAYGNYYFNVSEIFIEYGEPDLAYKYVGYGGVCFLGNINGKVPTNGLFYKDMETKKEIERIIFRFSYLEEEKSESVRLIQEHHGTPIPQHCILYQIA